MIKNYLKASTDCLRLSQNGYKMFSSVVKGKLAKKIGEKREVLEALKSRYMKTKVSDITVGGILGGMKGMPLMIYEASKVCPNSGISYRGKNLYEIRSRCPKAPHGTEPLPEGILWLFLTGEFPNQSELQEFQYELYERGRLKPETEAFILKLPKDMHPMTQFSMGIMACQSQSKFYNAYKDGIHKDKHWEIILEDALDLCAKVSRIAALNYQNSYRKGNTIADPDPKFDYSANYCRMLGFENQSFWELMRMYIVTHADHEGGNVSAHTTHLVGSALSDPYLSFSAGMNGLAGPLHGLSNQEALKYLREFEAKYGRKWNDKNIEEYVETTLASGRVVPGYGHPVLRITDPRFKLQLEFAEKHIKNDALIEIVKGFFRIVPKILSKCNRVKNPWPNIDAGSGALLAHYGLDKPDYNTVLFGVSRCFGAMASQVWSRALHLPIERPSSITLSELITMAKKTKE